LERRVERKASPAPVTALRGGKKTRGKEGRVSDAFSILGERKKR